VLARHDADVDLGMVVSEPNQITDIEDGGFGDTVLRANGNRARWLKSAFASERNIQVPKARENGSIDCAGDYSRHKRLAQKRWPWSRASLRSQRYATCLCLHVSRFFERAILFVINRKGALVIVTTHGATFVLPM
jgi:hypothetical protein